MTAGVAILQGCYLSASFEISLLKIIIKYQVIYKGEILEGFDKEAVFEAVFALAFAFAFPWLIARSLVFNAHNSAWRNIRFGFSAGYKEAFKVFILWPLLTVLTLGILSPYVFFRQKKFLVENSSYCHPRLFL